MFWVGPSFEGFRLTSADNEPGLTTLTYGTCTVVGDGQFAVDKKAALQEAGAVVRAIANRDYKPGEQAPDPNCKTVEDAHGVTLQFIQANYPSLFK